MKAKDQNRRGTVVIRLDWKKYGLEEGSLVIAEAEKKGSLTTCGTLPLNVHS
jgi:hypothetical protein